MSSDNFDNEVSELYQQRKAQVITPQISLVKSARFRRLSPISVLTIFSAASVASFGIMAIISHLTNDSVKKLPLYNTAHQIEIAETVDVEEKKKIVTVQKTLPPKPIIKQSSKTYTLPANHQVTEHFVKPEILATAQVQLVTLPQLKEPELATTPIYKVLPQYSINSLQSKGAGEIQLKYQITPAGTVKNIIMVKSSVSRKLQQSAKKALAQWQYAPSNNFKENYDVIFEFTAKSN